MTDSYPQLQRVERLLIVQVELVLGPELGSQAHDGMDKRAQTDDEQVE